MKISCDCDKCEFKHLEKGLCEEARQEKFNDILNPWHDAEKEKPEKIGKQYFVKVKIKNSGTIHYEASNFYSAGWGTELRLKNDRKVIAWMHIPKNEGEE